MAALKLHPFAQRKKRRRRLKALNLLRGKVEVRSKEEGFLGSWHKGTVISRKVMCFTEKFHVKYDHLLLDDSSDHIVESVNVSLVVSSQKKRSCINTTTSTRGYIRPLPPLIELNKWGLPFGLCVDVNHNEGWWEGVIFDYEDGFEERNVFFPDLGDEMVAPLSALRITQDWDEVSEEWTRRGTWMFLEVVEGYQIPVSIKQLWYDLQDNERMVGDWTCSLRSVWEEFVSGVVRGNVELVLDRLFDEVRVPQCGEKLLEIAESVSLSSEEEGGREICGFEVPVEEEEEVELASNGVNDSSRTNLHESNARCKAEPLVLVKSSPEGPETPVSCHSSSKVENSTGSTRFNKNRRYNLLPAKTNQVYRAKCCPEAVVEYVQLGAKSGKHLVTAAKQHLLYLKWSIKFYKDPNGRIRMRYVSPRGKCYDSLPNACRGLIKSEQKIPPLVSEHGHNTPPHSCISIKGPLMVGNSSTGGSETSDEVPQSKYAVKSNELPVICSPLRSKAAISRSENSRIHALLPAGPDIVHGAKFCPEAIIKYAQGVTGRDMAASVKQHLLYLEWSIKFYLDAAGVKRIRYISPTGKCYDSLPNVCRDLVKSEGKYPHLVTTHDDGSLKMITVLIPFDLVPAP